MIICGMGSTRDITKNNKAKMKLHDVVTPLSLPLGKPLSGIHACSILGSHSGTAIKTENA